MDGVVRQVYGMLQMRKVNMIEQDQWEWLLRHQLFADVHILDDTAWSGKSKPDLAQPKHIWPLNSWFEHIMNLKSEHIK